MSDETPPVFLDRRSYRRRRLGDAARMLPVLGVVLFLLPALGVGAERPTGQIVGLFAAWGALIVLSAGLSRTLTRGAAEEPDPPDG